MASPSLSVVRQTARRHVPALVRSVLSADIFPISTASVPAMKRMQAVGSPTASASVKADGLSSLDLKRLVRQHGWDAASGGSIVLSGKGRTTEAIRKEVIVKLQEAAKSHASSPSEPPVKVTNDGQVFGTSSDLSSRQCTGWESSADAPQEILCKLAAEVLQKQSRCDAVKNIKMSRWGNYSIELARNFSFKAAMIGGHPCISVLVSHKASPPPELNLAELCNADFPERVIGLEVRTFRKSMGKVVGFAGRLGDSELRSELLALTKCGAMSDCIRKAIDEEACWKVQLNGRHTFTYIASQLQPLLTFNNMERLDLIMGHAVKSQLARDSIVGPYERKRLVDAELDRLHKLVPDVAARLFPTPPSRVSSEVLSESFTAFETPKIVVGGNAKLQAAGGSKIWAALQKHGLFRYEPTIGRDLCLRGYILGSPTKRDFGRAYGTYSEMSETLGQLGLEVDDGSKPKAMKSLNAALNHAEKAGAHAVIFFSASGSDKLYYSAKQGCLGRRAPGLSHLASQWIDLSSDHKKPALLNMAVQLTAKVGHTPFVSDMKPSSGPEPALVGVDVCHLRNPKSGQMESVIAGLQLRRGNGEVEHSFVCQGKINGESIPDSVWKSVVSKEACAGRYVVIHRDGRFTENEKSFLAQHAKDIGAAGAFGMVEIVKHAAGTPRLYAGDKNAPSGSFLRISDTEGILTSGSDPNQGTRNPLLVNVVGSPGGRPTLSVEKAAEDIFRLSWLSYGTLYSQPRLPVTTKTADKAAYFHASADADQLASAASDGDGELALVNHGRQQYWL